MRARSFANSLLVLMTIVSLSSCAILSAGSAAYDADLDVQTIRRSLTVKDLERPLSQSTTTLSRGGYIYDYHNYTVLYDNAQIPREFWTKKTIREQPALAPRAFSFDDPSLHYLLWSNVLTPESDGKLRIRFCFADKNSREKLGCILEEAAQRWNDALQGQASIYLDITNRVCPRRSNGKFPKLWSKREYVVVFVKKTNGGESTAGLLEPFKEAPGSPKHHLIMGSNVYGSYEKTVATATHELGHTLGLQHEHQRPDAAQHVRLNFEAIRGYDKLQEYLATHRPQWPEGAKISGWVTLEHLQQYGELTLELEISKLWSGGAYVPWSGDANGYNILNEWSDFRPMSEFDRESVMLYGTDMRGAGEERMHFIPTAQRPERFIPWNTHPSRGDIAAISKLYPLWGTAAGSSGGQPDHLALQGLTIDDDEIGGDSK